MDDADQIKEEIRRSTASQPYEIIPFHQPKNRPVYRENRLVLFFLLNFFSFIGPEPYEFTVSKSKVIHVRS